MRKNLYQNNKLNKNKKYKKRRSKQKRLIINLISENKENK